MVSDLESVLDSLNIKKAHLVGHSFGARIALAFAAKHPDRILSIVDEDMELGPRQVVSDETCAKYAAEVKQTITDYAPYAWGCYANSADLRDTLKKYLGPILILRAAPTESAISEEGLKEITTLRPDIEIINFPTGHTVHYADPDGYAKVLQKFLSLNTSLPSR